MSDEREILGPVTAEDERSLFDGVVGSGEGRDDAGERRQERDDPAGQPERQPEERREQGEEPRRDDQGRFAKQEQRSLAFDSALV